MAREAVGDKENRAQLGRELESREEAGGGDGEATWPDGDRSPSKMRRAGVGRLQRWRLLQTPTLPS